MRRVLDGSPEPFAVANREKRAALSHFQPDGLLVSSGPLRADRRRFNEAVLDTGRPAHRLAGAFAAVVDDEPEVWLDGRARDNWSLVPCSGGPAACGGRELVLFLGGSVLAGLLGRYDLRLEDPARLDPERPLPRTLNHATLGFAVTVSAAA